MAKNRSRNLIKRRRRNRTKRGGSGLTKAVNDAQEDESASGGVEAKSPEAEQQPENESKVNVLESSPGSVTPGAIATSQQRGQQEQ